MAALDPKDGKRRLPLVSSQENSAERDARPAWQWSILGAVVVLLAWVPLAAAAGWLQRRSFASDIPSSASVVGVVAAQSLAFALASTVGGWFVARFGKSKTKHRAMAGIIASAAAWSLAFATAGDTHTNLTAWMMLLLLLVAIGALSAVAGGRLGRRQSDRLELG